MQLLIFNYSRPPVSLYPFVEAHSLTGTYEHTHVHTRACNEHQKLDVHVPVFCKSFCYTHPLINPTSFTGKFRASLCYPTRQHLRSMASQAFTIETAILSPFVRLVEWWMRSHIFCEIASEKCANTTEITLTGILCCPLLNYANQSV